MRTALVAAWLAFTVLATLSAQNEPAKPPPPAGAAARHGAASAPGPSVGPAPPKAPSATSPAPLPAPAPPAVPGSSDSPFAAGPFTYAPRYAPSQRPRPPYFGGSGRFGYSPLYELPSLAAPDEPPRATDDQLSPAGGLDLEIEPRSADVFVDGFYAGTADDLALNGLVLRAGPHWVDVRAPGYDTLTMQLSILAGQTVKYRRELVPASARQPASRPAERSQTIYVIPGCYAGNRPPNESALPSGCDIANLRVRRP